MTKKAERYETPWQNDVELALGVRPDMVLWRQMTGKMCPPYKPNVFLQVAPDGLPDLVGFQIRRMEVMETVNPDSFQPLDRLANKFYAAWLGIECKTDVGKQSPAQVQWQKIIRAHHGIYILAPNGRWDIIWRALGQEPDEACAEEADRLRIELGIIGGASAQNKPIRNTRHRQGR